MQSLEKMFRQLLGYGLLLLGLLSPITWLRFWFEGDQSIFGRVLMAFGGLCILFLSEIEEVGMGPFQLKLLRSKVEELNSYTRHIVRLWIAFIQANKDSDIEAKKKANLKFETEINELIQKMIPNKDERNAWLDESINN